MRGKRSGGVPATSGPGGIQTMPGRGAGLACGGMKALRTELVALAAAEGAERGESRRADSAQPAATSMSQQSPLSKRRTPRIILGPSQRQVSAPEGPRSHGQTGADALLHTLVALAQTELLHLELQAF